MTFDAWLHTLHFVRPLWLLALPPLYGIVYLAARRRARNGDWSGVIDADLLQALRLDGHDDGVATGMRPWPWLALAWTLAVLALAGPSWQRENVPTFRAPADAVILLDLSPSMAVTDVAPDRAARARYGINDLLTAAHDARVGLVAFSDEAYTVTPLTQDVATIRELLPSLAPDMMPSPGDHLAPGLAQAKTLLDASGAHDKRIIVLSDGFDDPAAALSAAAALTSRGVTISVVGVGTSGGAPLRGANGQFAREANGQPQLGRFKVDQLRQLATVGGGDYADIGELANLIANLQASARVSAGAIKAPGVEVSHWRDAGAFLLPALLLLAAVLTRRRWL